MSTLARSLLPTTLVLLASVACTRSGDEPSAQAGSVPSVATVGLPAPDFTLTDLDGNAHHLANLTGSGRVVVLEWFNPDCPISKDYHSPTNDMAATAAAFAERGVTWLAINSGAEGEQGAGHQRNTRAVSEYGIPFPLLLDMDGAVGRRYGALTTPHMFIVAADGTLVYEGAIDDGRPGKKGDVNYVRKALGELLADQPVTVKQSPPFGCSVKFGS